MANPKKPADSPKEQLAHDHTKGDCTEACAPASPTPKPAAGPELAKAKPADAPKAEAKAEAAPAATPATPPPPAKPTSVLYRVWPHGTLQRNGKVYQPGETLALAPEEGDKIVCLSRA